ncbi:MAG: histidine kinase [Saprospiraceae bacterium]|nr:histidine kinase [Saprospiraceae bacterium]
MAFKAVFRRNYSVHTAQKPQEAHDILSTNDIQVIISDQRMPGISGVEFLSEVSQQYPDVIRMILTGYSDMQAIIDAINKGKIYYYITKPWKFEELKVIIDTAIENFYLKQRNILLVKENHALMIKSLEQEKVQLSSQFEILINQLNPHFLFNSLSTLASLIGHDPDAAIRYTTKFAKMYRLTLEHGKEQLISVEKELEFLQTYVFLQQMRFGKNLSLELELSDTSKFVLPPYALQIPVENAIKHNVISEEKPMIIKITQNEETLHISNRIHKKQSDDISTGIGLHNLSHRYQIITGKDIQISNNEVDFIVHIPVISEE